MFRKIERGLSLQSLGRLDEFAVRIHGFPVVSDFGRAVFDRVVFGS